MDIFFGNFFWGMLIILFGVSIFLKGFGLNLPLAKVFIAIMIIMFGIKLLIGGKTHYKRSTNHNYRGSSMHFSSNRKEYTMVFSSGTIDLSDLPADAKDLEITVVFGSAIVLLPSDLRFDINASSVFGATVLPQKGQYGFGESNQIINPDSDGREIEIESTAVFGRMEYQIVERTGKPRTKTAPPDSTNAGDGF